MCYVPSVANDLWSQIYAPLNGFSEWGRYKDNCRFLVRWFRDGFSWSSYDLHPNIIPANFFWVKCVRFSPCHDRDFRKRPGDFRRFPTNFRISEYFRTLPKVNVRRLFPKTFEHSRSYLKDNTFSVLWYDFVRTQKRTHSHHVLSAICPDLWVWREKLSLMREIQWRIQTFR